MVILRLDICRELIKLAIEFIFILAEAVHLVFRQDVSSVLTNFPTYIAPFPLHSLVL
uniref:Uncharacterized protein n=1 Tax=Nelumbo nucifera TaxID=4432 RepID=A0A822ZVE7_NELNU|nr:TPA_asm: hypothetical protein HUJ06_016793 [Nelumbo nucifera]